MHWQRAKTARSRFMTLHRLTSSKVSEGPSDTPAYIHKFYQRASRNNRVRKVVSADISMYSSPRISAIAVPLPANHVYLRTPSNGNSHNKLRLFKPRRTHQAAQLGFSEARMYRSGHVPGKVPRYYSRYSADGIVVLLGERGEMRMLMNMRNGQSLNTTLRRL